MKSTIKVGDPIWIYEQEKNVYDKDGKYLRRGKWVEYTITGENKQSLLVGNSRSIAKKDLTKTRKTNNYGYMGIHPVAYSQEEVNDSIWMNKHRYKISEAVSNLKSSGLLRQVADLIGYEEK